MSFTGPIALLPFPIFSLSGLSKIVIEYHYHRLNSSLDLFLKKWYINDSLFTVADNKITWLIWSLSSCFFSHLPKSGAAARFVEWGDPTVPWRGPLLPSSTHFSCPPFNLSNWSFSRYTHLLYCTECTFLCVCGSSREWLFVQTKRGVTPPLPGEILK